MAKANAPVGFDYRGLTKTAKVPPSKVSVEELRRLHSELVEPSKTALERYITPLKKGADQTDEEFEEAKESIRALSGPVVRVIGSNGEQVTGLNSGVFDELPETVVSIDFESATALQSYNVTPLNRFAVKLDFSEPPKIADYNAGGQSTPNNSVIEVIGDDKAWVSGVYGTVKSFFEDHKRKRRWGWLHSRYTYNLAQAVLAIPAGIWIAFRTDSWLVEKWVDAHIIMRSAIFLYVVIFITWVFQGLMGSMRWAFPVVELEGSVTNMTRRTVGGIVGALLIALVYDVLKVFFWPTS